MINSFLATRQIGFLGAGNMSQAMIRGLLQNPGMRPEKIWVTNRSPGKLQKVVDQFQIRGAPSNEELVESSDIVVLAMKPQDLLTAIEPIARSFHDRQIVVSLAAGVRMTTLEKHLPHCRLVRLMPNTPSLIGRGILGYLANEDDEAVESLIEDLFAPLGKVLAMNDEDQLEALTVAAAAGTGFIFELMLYWQDWLLEHDFDPETARAITVETFFGASALAENSRDLSIEELQNRVASRKGVTAAGLQSMRELEIERALRISFEKTALRNSEISRSHK